MTIGTAGNRVTFNCDGVTKVFPVPLQAYLSTDFDVLLTSATGAQLLLTLNSDYGLVATGTLAPQQWTLTTLPVAAYATGYKLQVLVNPDQVNQTQYVQGQAFPSLAVQTNIDRLTQMVQRLQDEVGRTILAPDGDVNPVMGLPTAQQRANTYQTYDALGNTSTAVGLVPGTVLSAATIGAFTGPASAAELAAGVTVTAPWIPYGNVLRYGIVPNSSGSAAANTTIFVALVNASIAAGPTGLIYFPNNGSGAPDTYYFSSNAPAQIRDGITLDLGGCILNFSGAFNAAALNTFGFLNCIRDVTIQNGTIVVNYVSPQSGTGGAVNNGMAIRIGSRSGYGFGTYTTGIFDQDDLVAHSLPLQGNITLRNLRIKTVNPGAHIILALGGLRNLTMDTVSMDGGGVCLNNGFYYEYGWSSTNGTPGTQNLWTSSHMTASHFKSIVISNLATGGTSQGFGANGAYGCTAEDFNIITADQGLGFGAGESFFYRTWALDGTTQRIWNLRDITVKACPLGILMGGAQPISGYLSAVLNALAAPAKYQAQTDFLNYTLDGFSLSTPAGTAIIASGAEVSIRNGACNGGGIGISAECIHSTIENVQINGASGPNGIRYDFPSPAAIWSPARPIFTAVRNNKITNSTGVGIALGACQSALIENNQLGANTLYDVAAEAAQTNGVNIGLTSFGVRCRNNFTSTSGGAGSYQNANNNVNTGNSIEGELNQQTTTGGGGWLTDFQSASAQVIAGAGTIIVLNLRTVRLAPAAAVTGVIMAAGYGPGQTVTLVNESIAASSITFAASGTSRVAGGVGVVIAGVSKMILTWDSSTNLWY